MFCYRKFISHQHTMMTKLLYYVSTYIYRGKSGVLLKCKYFQQNIMPIHFARINKNKKRTTNEEYAIVNV